MGIKFIFFAILLFNSINRFTTAEPIEDKQALLDFKSNIYHSRNLNWNSQISACTYWTGITCNHDNSRVIAVRLPGIGFKGIIPLNTLGRLSSLQILSLRSNNLNGPFPTDLFNLTNLTGLYLQSNDFHGPLPSDFSIWNNLSVLNLSNNFFNGSIPSSLSSLTHLTALTLANNSLTGEIPNLDNPRLEILDLSNNNLTGVLPRSLYKFPDSSFSGNKISPEKSFPPAATPIPPPLPIKHSKFNQSAILGIVIGSCALAFILIALVLVFTNRKNNKSSDLKKKSTEKIVSSEHHDTNGRLNFFEGCNLAFDLEDLLRASAEVLGKGTFGTTYKAAIEDATTVAVKRLKEVVVGKRDFEQQMEVVGNIRHENVAPLRAYYYSKDEKLMVYDYYSHGSVASLLHANRGENRTPLDWSTRLSIALGASKGLSHIHSQNNGKLVHGNIKASNIFLNPHNNLGSISDLGLATLTNPVAPPLVRATGYRAPEVTDTRKATQASDIYSFGVVILELLTGKSPVYSSGGDEVVHLVRWVHSVVREEWTGEVFDVELLRYANIEEEMVSMLQVGMSCVSRMPEQRPKIGEVVKMVEGISGSTRSADSTPNVTPNVTPNGGEIGSSSGQS